MSRPENVLPSTAHIRPEDAPPSGDLPVASKHERMYPVTIEEAHQWVDELRDSLHRERAYIQRLEHDVSLQRDAIDTVLAQGGLAKTTMRRILRIAAAGCNFSLHRPTELTPLPDFRLDQITALQLRQKSWAR